jgi:nitrous oxide reductase accessory protein NosL
MVNPLRSILVAALLLMLGSTPVAAGQTGNPAPSPKDKCPVCGMFVAKYPNWLASARFKDGTILYFDGPKDLFSWYLDIKRYSPGRNGADIVALTVREYYSLKTIDAKSAFFVAGSTVKGPMGRELVPFATEADAASFMKDHGGKKVLRFKDVTPAILKTLN